MSHHSQSDHYFIFSETVQNADGPLLVEIGRSVGSDLGLTLQQRPVHGKPCIVIGNIATASIAER